VSYTDGHSINNNALHDLKLGADHGIVACGNSRLKTAKPGEPIIIQANDYFLIGRLIACAPEKRNEWLNAGGEPWPYCWTYTALTPILCRTREIDAQVKELKIRFGLKETCNPFNARLCPYAARPLVEELALLHPRA
jgi:hypothetical protein